MPGMEPGARSRADQTAPDPDRSPGAAGDPAPAGAPVAYRERLWVPIGWWVLTFLFALSLLVAVLFYLGPVWALGAGVLVMAVMGPIFVRYGRLQIQVAEDRLWVGGANVEWRYVAGVRALDPVGTRLRRGPEADARAYLELRPYLAQAVEITIGDDADPTPYWLVSSRHPARLAAAIRSRLDRSAGSVAVRHDLPAHGPERLDPPVPGDRLQS